MKRRSTCDMLRPCLVAVVYGEPHPEAELLRAHLRECAACRREHSELGETRSWIEGAADFQEALSDPAPGRTPAGGRARVFAGAIPLAAAIALLAILVAGRRNGGPLPRQEDLEVAGGGVDAASRAYGGEDIDAAIAFCDAKLRALERVEEEPW